MNGNYAAFLSLGEGLRGGEVRVEGVRVGVLGFGREVEGVRKGVCGREGEVGGLVSERKRVRRELVLGRGLVGVERGVGELEVGLGNKGSGWWVGGRRGGGRSR